MHKRLLAAPAHHEGEQHISGKLDFGKIFWKAGLWKGAPGGRNPPLPWQEPAWRKANTWDKHTLVPPHHISTIVFLHCSKEVYIGDNKSLQQVWEHKSQLFNAHVRPVQKDFQIIQSRPFSTHCLGWKEEKELLSQKGYNVAGSFLRKLSSQTAAALASWDSIRVQKRLPCLLPPVNSPPSHLKLLNFCSISWIFCHFFGWLVLFQWSLRTAVVLNETCFVKLFPCFSEKVAPAQDGQRRHSG